MSISRHAVVAALLSLPTAALSTQQPVPEIPFDASADFLKLPTGSHLGEVAGVAIDARRHLYVFSRTGVRSTVHGASASQLFEFAPDGSFIREIGKDLYGFAFAHTVRVDRNGDLWATDEGTNMIVKFNPAGRVLMVLGRRPEAVEGPAAEPAPGTQPRPGWGTFNRPTDVAWDRDGNVFVADGYNNSRVVKVDKRGRWVKTWGERGSGPGQFNILHSIANDAEGNIYVADRTNRRIQVFDPEGTPLRQFTIDVPYDKQPNVMVGAMPSGERESTRGLRCTVGDLHHARSQAGALQRRRGTRPHLQAHARWQGARRTWRGGQRGQAVRLGS
jgi:DNA-binding beta-propeller fold protein YncE